MSLIAVLLIVLLIVALWGAAPTFTNAPAAPSWVGLVVVVLVVLLLIDALGLVHLR